LLEVLVAFVILALSLGVLMRVFSIGLRNSDLAERYAYATLLAESKLAAAGIEDVLAEGATDGEAERGFRWQTVVSRFEDPDPSPASSPAGGAGLVELFRVDVVVTWAGEGDQEREVRLSTLRAAPMP
jgi:general secretion pathway protein I